MFMSVFKTLELFITASTSISIQFQLSPHILEVDLLRQHCGRLLLSFRTFTKKSDLPINTFTIIEIIFPPTGYTEILPLRSITENSRIKFVLI